MFRSIQNRPIIRNKYILTQPLLQLFSNLGFLARQGLGIDIQIRQYRLLLLRSADLDALRSLMNDLWSPYVGLLGQTIYIFILSFVLLTFFLSSPNLSGRRLDVFHTSTQWCGLSANLGCRSETCCTRLARNAGHKKSPKSRHLRTIVNFVGLHLHN